MATGTLEDLSERLAASLNGVHDRLDLGNWKTVALRSSPKTLPPVEVLMLPISETASSKSITALVSLTISSEGSVWRSFPPTFQADLQHCANIVQVLLRAVLKARPADVV
jgi:hypothetical protein